MANESAKSETPKVFAEEDLTGDGGVKKKIVKEGEGWRTPEKGYEVKINFVGKLENGTIFDSNAEKGEYIFKLGLGEVVKGLDKAISQMKKGEIALLTVQPAYGYEETGHGDKVPPNAILHYEVELIGWIEIKDVSPAKDGGIQKKIVKDGEGWESPNEDSKVKVSYKITLENGTVLHEKKDVEYICGDEDIPIAVDYAVQSMKKGEKGLVTVQPKYISHTTGFEVPKDQLILYELELVDFIKEKSSWDMTFEEKLEAAKKRKNEGNELFAKEKYARALKKYAKALEFFQYDSTLKPEDQAKAKEIKIPCYLNSAASNIKEKDFKKAVENATKVVDIDKNNVKAYYRRGVAYSELDEWENARKDFETALNIDPANKDVKREMIKLKKKIADQDKKDRQLFGGIFDKMAETRKQEEKKESAKQ